METDRPKVNDIVKIYCGDQQMSVYYGRVMDVLSEGILVDTLSDRGHTSFSFAANCIQIVGHEKTDQQYSWAKVGNVK